MKTTFRGAMWIAAGCLGILALVSLFRPQPPLRVTVISVQPVSGVPSWLSAQGLLHYRATVRVETARRRGMMLKTSPRAGFHHGYTCLYWDGTEWADAGAYLSLLAKGGPPPEWVFYQSSFATMLPGGTVLTSRVDLLSPEPVCKLVLEGWSNTNYAGSWSWAPRWLQQYLPSDAGEFHMETAIKLPKEALPDAAPRTNTTAR